MAEKISRTVVCIENTCGVGQRYELTIGKEYFILIEDDDSIFIENDSEYKFSYSKKLFTSPEEYSTMTNWLQQVLETMDTDDTEEVEDIRDENVESFIVSNPSGNISYQFRNVEPSVDVAEIHLENEEIIIISDNLNETISIEILQEDDVFANTVLKLSEIDYLIQALKDVRKSYTQISEAEKTSNEIKKAAKTVLGSMYSRTNETEEEDFTDEVFEDILKNMNKTGVDPEDAN